MTAVSYGKEWLVDLARTGRRRLANKRPLTGYIGWTFRQNLGDDAMLEAAQSLLRGPVEPFRGERREALLAGLGLSGRSRFSRIFLGGGTLINHCYLGTVERALRLGVPVSTLGTGAGSPGFYASNENVPRVWRDVLLQCRSIGVRGPRSLAKLQAIGVTRAMVVGDLALGLTPDTALYHMRSRRFLLNAAAASCELSERILAELVLAARRMTDLGWRALPVALFPGDLAPTARVLRDAGIEVPEIPLPRCAEDFFKLARHAGIAIGVRLHCAVLSSCAGVAPLGIAYREKGLDFADSMDLAPWMIDAARLTPGAVAERAEALSQTAEGVGAAAHAKALQWRDTLKGYVALCMTLRSDSNLRSAGDPVQDTW